MIDFILIPGQDRNGHIQDMTHTHALSINWSSHKTLSDTYLADYDIDRSVNRLNGRDLWSVSMWRLPVDDPASGLRTNAAKEFLQSAGSKEAMSVEMMVAERHGDDEYASYAIGKPSVAAEPGAVITWQDHQLDVLTNEVFTAEEAAEVYKYYRLHDTVPPGYTRRFIDSFPAPPD